MTIIWTPDQLLRGQQFRVGIGRSTILPDVDYETYSEAGLVYDYESASWQPLPGLSAQKKGLPGVGVRNYVCHPSFRLLSMAWDLKDGKGKRWWRPPELGDLFQPYVPLVPLRAQVHATPYELLEYVATFQPGQPREWTQGLLEAWNSGFEWQVTEFYCVPTLTWPHWFLEQMRCAMAKAKVSAYPPKLKDSGTVLGLTEQKDPKGEKLIRKLTMPRKPTVEDPSTRLTPQSAPKDFAELYAYNVQDIRSEAEASLKVEDLTAQELEYWLFDQRCNMRGMRLDRPAIDDCIAIVELGRAREHVKLAQITNGAVTNHTQAAAMLRWIAQFGIHLGELDEDTVADALDRIDYPAAVLAVLKIRQDLAFGSVNKLFTMRAQMTVHDRVHDQYSFAGAHTMLWNGQNIQMANLYRGVFDKPWKAAEARAAIATRSLEYVEYCFGPGSKWHRDGNEPMSAIEVVANYLRSIIIAADDHRFISADFTAIQAVVTSCLAREWWRIKVFQENGPLYLEMASRLTGNPVQFYLDYKKQHGKHHKDRQDWGKLPVLSGDFGAWITGWKRFNAHKILGADENIKAAILKTRAIQPNITEFWGGQTRNKFNKAPDGSYAQEYHQLYGLEGAAIAAVLEPGTCYPYNGVRYQMHEDVLYCAGPSGGMMRYHSPRLQRSTRDYARPWELELSYEGWNTNANKGRQNAWERMKLYGGVLTQNVVARESREVQAQVLLALDNHASGNYPIVMHTHDENVAEVRKGVGSVAEYMQIVRGAIDKLDWAVLPNGERWPVSVPDAWECEFYGKWED